MESTSTLRKRLPPYGLAFVIFGEHNRVFFYFIFFIDRLCAAYCALLDISSHK
jgi:hypothetical protein